MEKSYNNHGSSRSQNISRFHPPPMGTLRSLGFRCMTDPRRRVTVLPTPRCATCKDFRIPEEPFESLEDRWRTKKLIAAVTLFTLEVGIADGCQRCEMVREALQWWMQTSGIQLSEMDTAQIYCHNYMFTISVPSNQAFRTLEVFGIDNSPALWPSLFKAELISGDTKSDIALKWLQKQIETCIDGHDLCGSGPRGSLPKRVLDLSSDIRLRETADEHELFICLSHCWGAHPLIRTTSHNITQFKQRILLSDLPKTFQQAIEMTRQLGIQYLWIDSLCIIQDSPEDWAIESAKMAAIYKNAYLTIAATLSSDSMGGCFSKSQDTYLGHALSSMSDPNETSTLYVREVLEHLEDKTESKAPISSHLPLLQRAWVYQERVLSPRIVHFLPNELIFECSTSTVCECTRISSPFDVGDTMKAAHCKALEEKFGSKLIKEWCSIVEAYSRLKLTIASDRLPALSGIASEFSTFGRYLAGVWENHIVELLLWRTENTSKSPSLGEALPSWSWASRQVPITYNTTPTLIKNISLIKERASLVSAHCIPSTSNPFGNVSSGSLVMRGKLNKMILRRDMHGQYNLFESNRCNGIDLFMDFLQNEQTEQTVYCLRMGTFRAEESYAETRAHYTHEKYLVLQRVENTEKYVRLGIAQEFIPSTPRQMWINGEDKELIIV